MDIEEIKKLVDGDPDALIKKAEELGIDFESLDKDIAKKLVKGRFSLTEEQIETVDFIFWIAYFVERESENLIIYPEVQVGAREQAMEVLVDNLTFGGKIKVIEELHTGKKDPFIKLMKVIQKMRNKIAHGNFNDLRYGGYSLSDNRARIKLLANFRDTLLKKN